MAVILGFGHCSVPKSNHYLIVVLERREGYTVGNLVPDRAIQGRHVSWHRITRVAVEKLAT